MVRNLYSMIKKIVEDEGFIINQKKTQFLSPKVHKKIVGVTVNDGVLKASKLLKRNVRAMIHYQVITGDYSCNEQIRGYIAFINSIEENYRRKIKKYICKFLNDPITLFPDAVQKFNDNKLFNDLPDMAEHDILDFVDYIDYKDRDDYMLMINNERESYLLKMGIEI